MSVVAKTVVRCSGPEKRAPNALRNLEELRRKLLGEKVVVAKPYNFPLVVHPAIAH